MDEKATKRPWFQYHLSTLLVVTFTANAFMWANTAPQRTQRDEWFFDVSYGWPARYCIEHYQEMMVSPTTRRTWPVAEMGGPRQPRLEAIVFNVLFGLTHTVVVAVLFEVLTRKRQGCITTYRLLSSRTATYLATFLTIEVWFALQCGKEPGGWPLPILDAAYQRVRGALLMDLSVLFAMCGVSAALVEWRIRAQSSNAATPKDSTS